MLYPEGHVPTPDIFEVNDPDEEPRRDIQTTDLIKISLDTPGEKETLRNAWSYKDQRYDCLLEVETIHSRQRLFDIFMIVRGLIHTNKHASSITGFQVLRFNGASELTQEQKNYWTGMIRCSFESAGVILDEI